MRCLLQQVSLCENPKLRKDSHLGGTRLNDWNETTGGSEVPYRCAMQPGRTDRRSQWVPADLPSRAVPVYSSHQKMTQIPRNTKHAVISKRECNIFLLYYSILPSIHNNSIDSCQNGASTGPHSLTASLSQLYISRRWGNPVPRSPQGLLFFQEKALGLRSLTRSIEVTYSFEAIR